MEPLTESEYFDFAGELQTYYASAHLENRIVNWKIDLFSIACDSVFFDNITFTKAVRITARSESTLVFFQCHFQDDILFEDAYFSRVGFKECTFENDAKLLIIKCDFSNFILNDFSGRALFLSSKISSFSIIKSTTAAVTLENCTVDQILFRDNVGATSLFISETAVPYYFHRGNNIKSLNLHINEQFKGNVSLKNLSIGTIQMVGELVDATLQFTMLYINNLKVKNFYNRGSLKSHSILFVVGSENLFDLDRPGIECHNSDFGKATLFNIDFSNVIGINISNTDISKVSSSNVIWCDKIDSSSGFPLPPSLRVLYNQLKNLAKGQNDKPNELKYQSLEMRSYLQSLGNSNGRLNDKFILRFNQITNDHGQSWLRAFWWLALTVLITYFSIKVLLGFDKFAPERWIHALSEMAECFNPIRKFSDSYGLQGLTPLGKKAAAAKFVDIVFMRLLVGLLAFQMVKAFRKFVQ